MRTTLKYLISKSQGYWHVSVKNEIDTHNKNEVNNQRQKWVRKIKMHIHVMKWFNCNIQTSDMRYHDPLFEKLISCTVSGFFFCSVYNGGLWGNSLSFVVSSWNFVSGYIKIVDIHVWKFQQEIHVTSNKKVIANKPLTNLYETNSR